VSILETRGLTKAFGAVVAANDLSVSIAEDTVVGLIGGGKAALDGLAIRVTPAVGDSSGHLAQLVSRYDLVHSNGEQPVAQQLDYPVFGGVRSPAL